MLHFFLFFFFFYEKQSNTKYIKTKTKMHHNIQITHKNVNESSGIKNTAWFEFRGFPECKCTPFLSVWHVLMPASCGAGNKSAEEVTKQEVPHQQNDAMFQTEKCELQNVCTVSETLPSAVHCASRKDHREVSTQGFFQSKFTRKNQFQERCTNLQ